MNAILASSTKEKDQILSFQLKDKQVKNGSITLSQRAGKPIKVSMNQPNSKQTPISVNVVQRIQSSYRLTQNETLGIASMFRQATRNRKAIEPNLKKSCQQ